MTLFYKTLKDGRNKFIDFDDICEGESCILVGGAPSLKNENLDLLRKPGVATIGINNVATLFKPTFWISGDKPDCFVKQILYDPSIIKFINWSRRANKINGQMWGTFPNTYSYSCVENITINNFLTRGSHLAWWKNTWFIALQLAYKLGFRKVYMVGADFKISTKEQYAWETDIKEKYINMNVRLYQNAVNIMRDLIPHFSKHNFEVFNCSRTSALRADFGFLPLEEAVKKITKNILFEKTNNLPHSRALKENLTKNNS